MMLHKIWLLHKSNLRKPIIGDQSSITNFFNLSVCHSYLAASCFYCSEILSSLNGDYRNKGNISIFVDLLILVNMILHRQSNMRVDEIIICTGISKGGGHQHDCTDMVVCQDRRGAYAWWPQNTAKLVPNTDKGGTTQNHGNLCWLLYVSKQNLALEIAVDCQYVGLYHFGTCVISQGICKAERYCQWGSPWHIFIAGYPLWIVPTKGYTASR